MQLPYTGEISEYEAIHDSTRTRQYTHHDIRMIAVFTTATLCQAVGADKLRANAQPCRARRVSTKYRFKWFLPQPAARNFSLVEVQIVL